MSNQKDKTPVMAVRCPRDVKKIIVDYFGAPREGLVLLAKWAKEVAALEADSIAPNDTCV